MGLVLIPCFLSFSSHLEEHFEGSKPISILSDVLARSETDIGCRFSWFLSHFWVSLSVSHGGGCLVTSPFYPFSAARCAWEGPGRCFWLYFKGFRRVFGCISKAVGIVYPRLRLHLTRFWGSVGAVFRTIFARLRLFDLWRIIFFFITRIQFLGPQARKLRLSDKVLSAKGWFCCGTVSRACFRRLAALQTVFLVCLYLLLILLTGWWNTDKLFGNSLP